ncbi:MAG: hypothetical protein ABI837_13560, partial [Acidobacteriota bacterium]
MAARVTEAAKGCFRSVEIRAIQKGIDESHLGAGSLAAHVHAESGPADRVRLAGINGVADSEAMANDEEPAQEV